MVPEDFDRFLNNCEVSMQITVSLRQFRMFRTLLFVMIGSNIVFVAICAVLFSRLMDTIIAATMNSYLAVSYASRDAKIHPAEGSKNRGATLVSGLIGTYQRANMYDRKTALAVFEALRKFPGAYELLDPKKREYVDRMRSRWGSKSLGFPDAW